VGFTLCGAVAVGIVPRLKEREARARVAKELAAPRRVRVARVRAGEPHFEISLPGTSAPFFASTLYSKSTGFVRRNAVDVGDRVKAGQLLAIIEAPETEEDVRLARARLAEAQANVGIARSTASRASKLATVGFVSQQQSDDVHAQENSAVAAVATRQAELQRLTVLRGYQQIFAPFDGVITRRGTDPGMLVSPAGAGSVPLFEIADTKLLRVTVEVPDAYAADVKVGDPATVFSPHDPAHKVSGKVARTSGVLEQATRTLRAEVHVPGEGAPLPGAFVYVTFQLTKTHPAPLIPASALLVRKEGTLVAKADTGSTLTLLPIKLGRDFGKELEVLDGVNVGDRVVMNPSDELETGQRVELAD
jgi:RND family efflux transporter MFP subunit